MSKKLLAWVFLFVLSLTASLQAQFNLLHSFAGGPSEGASPSGSLILSGSTLYGMTDGGGANDDGTIFKINKDGTGYAVLHSFAGGPSDGRYPYRASLILKGSTLYGMTFYGGTSDAGTIFKINKNGTGFALLHSFAGGVSDGESPVGSLIIKGSTFYGTTSAGGTAGLGTIFKILTNGMGFALLHSFTGGASDGRAPYGSLIIKGSTFYGTTSAGGTDNDGTIFKINKNGTGFALLHSFADGASDGQSPYGSLTISGATLYGMTLYAGTDNIGTIFKIDKNGTGFALLHSFAGYTSDGEWPNGSLVLKGSLLYGLTQAGGGFGIGTIFKINTTGTGFAVIHSFVGATSDGALPIGALILKGFTAYGLTYQGGSTDSGVIFSFNLKD